MRIANLILAATITGIFPACGVKHQCDAVHVAAYASNPTPALSDTIALSSVITTEGTAYISSQNWVFTSGPTTPWIRTPSSNQTIVSFTQPGIYSFTYRVFWWDSSNNRREDEASVSVQVMPAGSG